MKILDCTLRDGGYYTKWDFDSKFVEAYIKYINKMPVEYIEIGYRSPEKGEYMGEYFYLPLSTIKNIKSNTSKKLSIMLNLKDCKIEHIENLLLDLVDVVTLIRIAIDPKNIEYGILLAKKIKILGFEVAFNIMYISKIKDNDHFFSYLTKIESIIDYLYLVDSYGSIYPNKLKKLIRKINKLTPINLGFHGHNNIELAFINSLEAINNGCVIIDSTILGMGRGAGNLKTELLLVHLKNYSNLAVDLNILGNLVELFIKLSVSYQWGTNLAYMVSGSYSLPQKEVMEALGINRYSLSGIVNQVKSDYELILPRFIFNIKNKNVDCLIVGGGDSVEKHFLFIQEYLNANKEIIIIHSSSRHVKLFENLNNIQFLSIAGDELLKINTAMSINSYILQPRPRKINNPLQNKDRFYELESIDFIDHYFDSPLTISFQVALDINADQIYLVGFDGYKELKTKKELYLMQENQKILDSFQRHRKVITLTDSKYKNILRQSIYGKIYHGH